MSNGLFDDLIPGVTPRRTGGLFGDLVPEETEEEKRRKREAEARQQAFRGAGTSGTFGGTGTLARISEAAVARESDIGANIAELGKRIGIPGAGTAETRLRERAARARQSVSPAVTFGEKAAEFAGTALPDVAATMAGAGLLRTATALPGVVGRAATALVGPARQGGTLAQRAADVARANVAGAVAAAPLVTVPGALSEAEGQSISGMLGVESKPARLFADILLDAGLGTALEGGVRGVAGLGRMVGGKAREFAGRGQRAAAARELAAQEAAAAAEAAQAQARREAQQAAEARLMAEPPSAISQAMRGFQREMQGYGPRALEIPAREVPQAPSVRQAIEQLREPFVRQARAEQAIATNAAQLEAEREAYRQTVRGTREGQLETLGRQAMAEEQAAVDALNAPTVAQRSALERLRSRGGAADPMLLTTVARTAAGGLAGAALGDTPEERAAFALAGATGTFAAPSIVRRLVRPADVPITDATTKKLLAVWERANPKVEGLAAEFMGGEVPRPLARATTLDRPFTKRIADWYDSAVSDPTNPEVRAAYRAFADETRQQYDFLRSKGITFEFVDTDPYKSSAEMMRDVADNNRLKVLKTEAGMHPLLTEEENDMFRAVHDFFGHAKEGHQFGQLGEENAYRVHSAMYSPEARRVMATETRGQNSWVNNQPANLTKPGSVYAEQKVALMPEEFMGEYPIERVAPEVVTNVEFQSKLTPGFTNTEVKSLSNIERKLGRAAFMRKVVEPIVKSEGLPVTVAKGLGSWLSEGDPGITEAARLNFSQMSPMAIQRVLSRVSQAARQMGFFFSVPNPEGPSVAVTLDFGRALKEPEYKAAIERLTAADNGQLFNGTTMVKLDPAKVQIVLNDGVDEQGAESLVNLARQALPQYNTRGTVQRVEPFFPNDAEKLDDAFAEYFARIGYLTPEQAQIQQRAITAYGQLAQAGPVRRALAAGAPALAEAAGELGRAGLRRLEEMGTGPTAVSAGRAGLGALAGIAATPSEAGAQGQEGVGRFGPSALFGAAALAGPRALRGRAALGAVGSVLSQAEDEKLSAWGRQIQGLALASAAFPVVARGTRAGGAKLRDAMAQSPAGRRVLNTISRDILVDPRVKELVEAAVEETARYRAIGQELAAEARRLGPEGDRIVSDLVERENFEQAVLDPNDMAAAIALANRVSDAVAGLGQEKVGQRLISPTTFAARQRTYLRRMYGKYAGEAAMEEMPAQAQAAPFRIKGEKQRLDLTPEQRNELGEIREASYRVAETFGRGGRDVASARLFNALVEVPGAVEPQYKAALDEVLAAKNVRDIALQRGDETAAREASRNYLAAKATLRNVSEQFKKRTDFVTLPDTPGLGVLRGAVVRPDVAEYLTAVPELSNTKSTWNDLLSAWKKIHTVYNPGTHVGNFVSNAAVAHMAGLPIPLQPAYLTQAAKDIKAYGPATKALTERGILERGLPLYGDQPVKGVAQDKAALRALARTTRPETRAALAEQGIQPMGRVEAAARAVESKVTRAYALEDGVYRVALFQKFVNDGLDADAAAKKVMESLPGYDTRSPLLKGIKNTVSPFVLYPAKYIPAVTRMIMEHPERWIALTALWAGLDQVSRRQYEPLEEKDLPKNQRSRGYILPGRIQVDAVVRPAYEALGVDVPEGDKYTFDVARWTPFSALTGSPAPGAITTQISEDIPAILQPGGPIQDVGALMLGRDPYTGDPLIEPGMTGGEKARAIGGRLASFVTPSAVSFQIPRVIKDMQRGDTAAAALDALGLVGLRPSVVKPGLQEMRERKKYEEAVQGIRSRLRLELRRNRDEERAQQLIENAQGALQAATDKYLEAIGQRQ